jgi:hypothetical protein
MLPSSARADAIDDYVRRQMAVSHIPGVAVAIVRKGQVESIRSYGEANIEWNAPVGPDTRFQIASATKLFTGDIHGVPIKRAGSAARVFSGTASAAVCCAISK